MEVVPFPLAILLFFVQFLRQWTYLFQPLPLLRLQIYGRGMVGLQGFPIAVEMRANTAAWVIRLAAPVPVSRQKADLVVFRFGIKDIDEFIRAANVRQRTDNFRAHGVKRQRTASVVLAVYEVEKANLRIVETNAVAP